MRIIRKGLGLLVGIPLLLIAFLLPIIVAIAMATIIGWASGEAGLRYLSFVPLGCGAIFLTGGWWIRSAYLKAIVIAVTIPCGITKEFTVTNW